MNTPTPWRGTGEVPAYPGTSAAPQPANLADLLERVLDKGIVIAGDIRINLLDIELLTIRIRLLVASVDKAREMGIDWWEHDPTLSSGDRRRDLEAENRRLRERLGALEAARSKDTADPDPDPDADAAPEPADEPPKKRPARKGTGTRRQREAP
ncbi:gas vesicle protein [Kitasatospora cineracea]|uniref:Gas vesicle protein GvpA/GvpJ/GvpM family n=1 Tax=Kitasatospora cineracea TaxID=88074 RepID=A0A3N4SDC0_9ACTN|nr:gas vesicle protein GvpA/GvpJ/GvpM family [Kitasatospora cineracea]